MNPRLIRKGSELKKRNIPLANNKLNFCLTIILFFIIVFIIIIIFFVFAIRPRKYCAKDDAHSSSKNMEFLFFFNNYIFCHGNFSLFSYIIFFYSRNCQKLFCCCRNSNQENNVASMNSETDTNITSESHREANTVQTLNDIQSLSNSEETNKNGEINMNESKRYDMNIIFKISFWKRN